MNTRKSIPSSLPPVNRIGMRGYGLWIEQQMNEIRRENIGRYHRVETGVEHQQQAKHTQENMANVRSTQMEIPAFESDSDTALSHLEHDDLPEDYRNMTMYQRTIAYAMILQRFGFSNEEIATIEDMMAIVYGAHPLISYNEHVRNLNKELLQEYRRDRYFFCCSCNEEMHEGQIACERSNFNIRGISTKRAKYTQKIEVHSVNIVPQLSDILTNNFESILCKHEEIHMNGERRAPVEPALTQDEFVDVEESFAYGNVRERREFREEGPPGGQACEPSTLYDCVRRGVLNMGKAAALICKKRQDGTFNSAVYEEFVQSDIAYRSKPNFEDLDNEQENWWSFNNVALRLLGEINRATHLRLARTVEFTEKKTVEYGTLTTTVDLKNCTNAWRIEANPPFKTYSLKALAAKWQPRKKDVNFQKIGALYRHLLTKMTDPPQAIQQYSMRMNRRSGRDEKLSNLPEHIEEALLGFGKDVLGFGRREITDETMDVGDSAFYIGLGSTEEERRQALEKLRVQRSNWTGYLFAALQKALRDVRSYTYNMDMGWIPAKKQSKKAAVEDEEAIQRRGNSTSPEL